MHLSLFSRLTIGYLAIFAIVAAASTYAIVELTIFGNQAESILRIDNRVLDHEKFLTDLLLAQSRSTSLRSGRSRTASSALPASATGGHRRFPSRAKIPMQ